MLASWSESPSRAAIVAFVQAVTDPDGERYVPEPERVAVFDNDGTLWTEKPIPIQLDFTLFRMAELAAADPSLAEVQPYKAAAEKDYHWLGAAMVKHYHGDDADMGLLMAAVENAFEGLTVEAFAAEVSSWLETARHPTLDRPYLSCGFVPMIELLRYFEANGFTNYIASGGDRDFMRPFAEGLYGIPPERIIGSALGLTFDEGSDVTGLMYKSKMEVFDDGPEKPVRIWGRLGRRPVIAVGNSNGDVQMLRFARTDDRPGLRLLVLHDDADREFDYTQGAEDALARAADHDWTVVSVADDWTTVFPAL
ncbi:HAD family hydrolase [Aquihabitans sp. McL0605]|uniref:HAD family hydrolase n=1 Tax=Aquihabitans sp. McL0605 TaxID=3415671 RepID=UPI003CF131B9